MAAVLPPEWKLLLEPAPDVPRVAPEQEEALRVECLAVIDQVCAALDVTPARLAALAPVVVEACRDAYRAALLVTIEDGVELDVMDRAQFRQRAAVAFARMLGVEVP